MAQQSLSQHQLQSRSSHMSDMASRIRASGTRAQSDESWVEIASQPSSSSLSSAAEGVVTTGLRVQHSLRSSKRRRRSMRLAEVESPVIAALKKGDSTSSQEEYDESESESDRVMTSSEELPRQVSLLKSIPSAPQSTASDDSPSVAESDDDGRTTVNHPIKNESVFTPQPNAFSHPPSTQLRSASQPVPGSYFPTISRTSTRPEARRASERSNSHVPRNILSPSYNTAAHHDEALRASLSTLLSCAAAARGLKTDSKTSQPATIQPRSNKVEPMTLRLVPESALRSSSSPTLELQEPIFHPTLRRASTTTIATTDKELEQEKIKRKGRSASKERRAIKKQRRTSHANDDMLFLSPTLLTWVVSAGVVVALSALSFTAGYSLGKEAGRLEATSMGMIGGDHMVRDCAREASRSSLGLKRSLARSAVQV